MNPLHTVTQRSRLALAVALLATAALVGGSAAGAHTDSAAVDASPGLRLLFPEPGGTALIEQSADGYARLDRDPSNRLLGGYLISYRRLTITLLDGKARRLQELPLTTATQRLKQVQKAMRNNSVEAPTAAPQPVLRGHLGTGSRVIDGHRASLITATLAGTKVRGWYISGPAPPAAVTRALRLLQPVAGDALPPGALVVRQEQLRGGKWLTSAAAKSISKVPIPATVFNAPAGWKQATLLGKSGPKAQSVPATVARTSTLGYIPSVQQHQRVYAMYWGARFGREPATVAALNGSFGVIEHNPYVAALAQYDGIGEGRISGSTVIASNPPRSLGNADISGIAAATGPVNSALFAAGSPGIWFRWSPEQPLYVIFVPQEAVEGAGNNGYHAGVPIATAWLDPAGVLQLPIVPYAVVKVPQLGGRTDLTATTITLSHETVETATDPFGVGGWRQPSPPAGEQGELADICWEGTVLPFARTTRLAGVAVSTYWSQRDRACVPAGNPTVTITQPAAGASIAWGPRIALRATATDPMDGPLPESSIVWTVDGLSVAPDALHTIATLTPGTHTAVATVTNSQGVVPVSPARRTFTVLPPAALTVLIDTPADFAQIGKAYAEPVTFSATLVGAPAASFVWRDDIDGPLGTGRTISHTLTGGFDFQRVHHVTVTATATDGRTATRTITVISGFPG